MFKLDNFRSEYMRAKNSVSIYVELDGAVLNIVVFIKRRNTFTTFKKCILLHKMLVQHMKNILTKF